MLLVLQTDEPQLEESIDPGREPPAGETVEGQGVMEVGEKGAEESVPEQGGEEESRDPDNPQIPPLKTVEGDAEDAEDKVSADADVKDPETTSEKKDGEEERTEEEKVKEDKPCEKERDGEEMRDQTKEKKTTEQKAKEAKKDVKEKAAKAAEKKKQVEADVETTDSGKMKEVEKQGKPKRKSAPPSSSVSRPRQTARSIRAAAKNDIIAKFQQGAPE